jgi:hypothetical protein
MRLAAVTCFACVLPALPAQLTEHRLYLLPAASDGAGRCVCLAGDVDGDGHADLVVGAPSDTTNGRSSGRIDVVSGRHGGRLYSRHGDGMDDWFGTSIAAIGDVDRDQRPDFVVGGESGRYARVFSGRTGAVLYTFRPTEAAIGRAVASAGDANKDGVPDVLVSTVKDWQFGIGGARVFSGSDGRLLLSLTGGAYGGFGSAVCGLGDLNGDGHDDLAVSSPYGGREGMVQAFSGRDGTLLLEVHNRPLLVLLDDSTFGTSLAGPGDLDGDSVPDLWIGHPYFAGEARAHSGKDGSLLFAVTGLALGDELGRSVSGAGDVDRDGRNDLVMGASPAGFRPGYALVASGRDGRVLLTFSDGAAGQNFGWSVSGGHDVDRDGVPDLAVGCSTFARVLSGRRLELTTDAAAISLGQGGKQPLDLHAGQSQALRLYLLVGSASGREPGLALGSLRLPLNPDGYMLLTLAHPNVWIRGSLGLLDAEGRATATFDWPAGLAPELAGLTLDHAYVTFDAGLCLALASNAAALRLEP